ncbi:MAG: Wzy polymerase domain-containing protein [Rhodoferax sp.]|nr:Wzy polymerase domain-containing protein [Rhodoferax sp.]
MSSLCPFRPNPRSHASVRLALPALWWLLVLAALCAPWLSAATWGPQPDMVQRLLSIACMALLLPLWMGNAVPPTMLARSLAWAWLLAAVVSSGMGLLQYMGIDASPWVSASQPGVAFANLRQRNQFASLTALGLVALLYLAQTQRPESSGHSDRARPWRVRWHTVALLCAAAVLALGHAASSSRTGVLQWVLLLGLALGWSRLPTAPRTPWRWALLALGLALLLAWLLPLWAQGQTGVAPLNALQRFQEASGCGDRSVLWANMAELIGHRPWTGWGWGDLKFAHFMQPYAGERFCEILDNAHNLPLHLAVELGLPAALLICAASLAVVLHQHPWRETSPERQLAWAALAVLALHSLLEYPLWYGPFQMAVLLCAVLLWRSRAARVPPPPQPALQWFHPAWAAVAAVVLAATAYASWDYWRVGQLYLPPETRDPVYREDTLAKAQSSWLFRDTVRFAYVTTTEPTTDNAEALYAAALQALHYSPEPRVIDVLLECARLLGRENAAVRHIRVQAQLAYPAEAGLEPAGVSTD